MRFELLAAAALKLSLPGLMRINRVQACLHNFLSYVVRVCLTFAERASRGSDERKLEISRRIYPVVSASIELRTYQFYRAVLASVALKTSLVRG